MCKVIRDTVKCVHTLSKTHTDSERQRMVGQSTGDLTFHPRTSDSMNQLSIRVNKVKEKRGTERERDVRYQKERTNISISSVCPVPADQVTRLLCMGWHRGLECGNSGRAQWWYVVWWLYVIGELWTQKRRINLSLSLLPTPNIEILLRYQQADKNKVPDKGTLSLHLLTSWRGEAAAELWHLPVTTSNDCSMLQNSLTDHWRGQIYLEHLPVLKYSSLQEKHIQEIFINCLTTEMVPS